MKIFNVILIVGAAIWYNPNAQNIQKLYAELELTTQINEPLQNTESIKISELVNNKTKYNGKVIQLTGKCTKINANIMGRNWIHLKDGSMDEFDLVITSDANVPEGETVTMSGVVVLNKDFGAGYKYDLIIELGKIVPGKE